MSATEALRELDDRLELARRVLVRSTEPLHAPLGLVFRPMSGEAHMHAWASHAARAAKRETFSPATLYVHSPFCARVCTYCLLSAVRTPGKAAVAAYVAALRRQIALYEPIVRGLAFGSLHVGGGTPTLLDEAELDALFTDLSRLPLAAGAQIGVEAHPATSTPAKLALLKRHGVHRLSFGVESLTPEVLRNVNRADQTDARVEKAVGEARRLGFTVNIDLLAGLPGESEESWRDTVDRVVALEPDSLSVNRFLGENSALARRGLSPDEDDNRRVDRMLAFADERIRALSRPRWPEEPLARPGFGTQYVWERGDGARRYFQDDMIGPVSTLAIGHGALGHVYGDHFSVAGGSLDQYVESLARGAPPGMLACAVDERFEMAFFAADQAVRGALSLAAFHRVFGRDLRGVFARELAFLLERRLLVAKGDRVTKPERGDFQLTHLLAFLLRDTRGLASDLEALDAAAARKLPLADADDRAVRQYEAIGAELPPSMLWVRLAIRASQASRGEQRMAFNAPASAPPPDRAPSSTV